MIARDWHVAIALTEIVFVALTASPDRFFWFVGCIDGIEFHAKLPDDGGQVFVLHGGADRYTPVRGSTGGAPLMSLNLLIAAVRRRAGVRA